MRQYLLPIVKRIYGLNIRAEIVSENTHDVQRYRWDQTQRLGKKQTEQGLWDQIILVNANIDKIGVQWVKFEYHDS